MGRNILTLLMQRRQLIHISTPTTLVPEVYVVPNLRFTTDGLLQKWIFVSQEDSNQRFQFPHFRVWRRTGQSYTAVNGTHTMGSNPVRSRDLNVYEYTLDPPAPVEYGDFIGWEQLGASDTRFLPLLVDNTGYSIQYASNQIGNTIRGAEQIYRANPLIGVQLLGKKFLAQYKVTLLLVII